MSKLKIGDHIVVNFDIAGVTEHHGIIIEVEPRHRVIHLSKKSGKIVISGFKSFSDGEKIRLKNRPHNPSAVVKRAKQYLNKSGYSICSNNCEQFVNLVIKGRSTSNQVSNTLHAVGHTAARYGALGSTVGKAAAGPIGAVTIISTGAKYTAEYLGASDDVSTIVGGPGDLIAKPAEAVISGTFDTISNTYDKLSEGEIIDATGELVSGVAKTAFNTVKAPVEVVGDVVDAVGSVFRRIF